MENAENEGKTYSIGKWIGVGCLSIFVIVIIIIGIIFYTINEDVSSQYKYRKTYTWEENQKFEKTRDSVLFTTFKQDVEKLAIDWNNQSLEKKELIDPTFLKEQLLFVDADYADTILMDLIIETPSFSYIENGGYDTYITSQEKSSSEIMILEDLALNAFKYQRYDKMQYSEAKAIERAASIPYFLIIETKIIQIPKSPTKVTREIERQAGLTNQQEKLEKNDMRNVFVYDRNVHKIVKEFQIKYSKDINSIKSSLKKEIIKL